MLTLSGLQAKLLEHKIVMPLPWTDLATNSFCCGSCVGAELPLPNQPKDTEGYVWFNEQSLNGMPTLYLSWSLVGNFTPDQQVAFGYKLYWVFSNLGLSPEWDGNTTKTIAITVLNYTEFEVWYEGEHEPDDEDDEDDEEHPEWAMDGWDDEDERMEGDDDDEALDRW